MKIVLNETLKPNFGDRQPNIDELRYGFDRKMAPTTWNQKEGKKVPVGEQFIFLHAMLPHESRDFHRGFLGLLANAYSRHLPIAIYPHDLWFIVLGELAKYVNSNSDSCRSLFTSSPGKVDIKVMTNDPSEIDPLSLIHQLRKLVPSNIDQFLPKLESAPPMANVAMAAAFCDMVKSHYTYVTFMCGIPSIMVAGTREEWLTLAKCVSDLGETFKDHDKVVGYLAELGVHFHTIALAADGVFRIDHWKDIFTSKNAGSGGELNISGWITDFFLEKPELPRLENFLYSQAIIPYSNLETGRKFKAIYGAFSELQDDDGFVYSGYGYLVYEQQ